MNGYKLAADYEVDGGIQYDTYAPSASNSYLGTGKHGPHRQLAVDPLWTTGAFTLVSPVILGEWVTDGRARQEHRKYSPVPWSTADGQTYSGAVAMSSDGSVVVIARAESTYGQWSSYGLHSSSLRVNVLQRDAYSTWSLQHQFQDDSQEVRLSADGTVLLMCGGEYMQYPEAKIYAYSNGQWALRGSAFPELGINDRYENCDLSSDGLVVVLSILKWNDNIGTYGGQEVELQVHKWNGNSWQQIGDLPVATRYNGHDGKNLKVALNSDGTMVVVASYSVDKPGSQGHSHGCTWVRQYSGGTAWSMRGNPICGDNTNDMLGSNMAFSDNGMVIALAGYIGTYVRIFEWSDANSDWTQRGGDLSRTGGFWESMALSADGAILAIYADNSGAQFTSTTGKAARGKDTPRLVQARITSKQTIVDMWLAKLTTARTLL